MIDLHLHLDGSLNPKKIFQMAEMAKVELPTKEEQEIRSLLMVEPTCTDLGEYLEKFELPLQVLQTEECIEFAVYELLHDLSEQGLCYAEIRFAPQLHMKCGLSQEKVVQAAILGLRRGICDFEISANLILCCMRGIENKAQNLETVQMAKKFLHQGVCALDLAGNEAAYPTELFEEIFKQARQEQIPVIIHAGEAAGPESVRCALQLGAVRIGHGIHAVSDTALMSLLKENNIYLELCYSSNLQTKTVERVQDYPILQFMEEGILVTVNTDNMTVSNTSLKREYKLLQEQFHLSVTQLCELALHAADGAFLPEQEKKILKEKIKKEFLDWMDNPS